MLAFSQEALHEMIIVKIKPCALRRQDLKTQGIGQEPPLLLGLFVQPDGPDGVTGPFGRDSSKRPSSSGQVHHSPLIGLAVISPPMLETTRIKISSWHELGVFMTFSSDIFFLVEMVAFESTSCLICVYI